MALQGSNASQATDHAHLRCLLPAAGIMEGSGNVASRASMMSADSVISLPSISTTGSSPRGTCNMNGVLLESIYAMWVVHVRSVPLCSLL
jgi:hypothetical protein